ncbi:MAG TPA: hypothetical protein VE913_19245 [Longimicrobium sp.]|nr:hypothetical protein [Longimicrobium sp.]
MTSWAELYGNSSSLQALIVFAHLGGMLVGGGFALAADRATLRAANAHDRARQLAELRATHRPVLVGLAVTLGSGLLMLAADVGTYLGSVTFWVKMGLIVLLLANGYAVRSTRGMLEREPERAWMRLRAAAAASFGLWLGVLLAGSWLTNAL